MTASQYADRRDAYRLLWRLMNNPDEAADIAYYALAATPWLAVDVVSLFRTSGAAGSAAADLRGLTLDLSRTSTMWRAAPGHPPGPRRRASTA